MSNTGHLLNLSRLSIDPSTIKQIEWDIVENYSPVSSIDIARGQHLKTYIYCSQPPLFSDPSKHSRSVFILDGSYPEYEKDVEKLKLAVGAINPPKPVSLPAELLNLLQRMPPTTKRRPLDDDKPDSWQESDLDYLENNLDAAAWFLDHAEDIRALLRIF